MQSLAVCRFGESTAESQGEKTALNQCVVFFFPLQNLILLFKNLRIYRLIHKKKKKDILNSSPIRNVNDCCDVTSQGGYMGLPSLYCHIFNWQSSTWLPQLTFPPLRLFYPADVGLTLWLVTLAQRPFLLTGALESVWGICRRNLSSTTAPPDRCAKRKMGRSGWWSLASGGLEAKNTAKRITAVKWGSITPPLHHMLTILEASAHHSIFSTPAS